MSPTRPPARASGWPDLSVTHPVQRAVGADSAGAVRRLRCLPRVLDDSPASVLLLDLADDAVVQADSAGRDLVPGQRLPTGVADWVAAADVRRGDGGRYAPGEDAEVRDRAVVAAGLSFTISDPTDPALLVGAALGTHRPTVEERVEPGTVLVLYTDGLVEHRGRGLDEGLRALQDALRTAPDDAQGSSDHLLAELAGDLDDDVAMLVLRVL